MKQYCPLCGSEFIDGACPNDHSFKKMCLNCAWLSENEAGELVCSNEQNQKDAAEKVRASIIKESDIGYSIKNLAFELSPLPLKKPTLKCGKWTLDVEKIEGIIFDSFK